MRIMFELSKGCVSKTPKFSFCTRWQLNEPAEDLPLGEVLTPWNPLEEDIFLMQIGRRKLSRPLRFSQ